MPLIQKEVNFESRRNMAAFHFAAILMTFAKGDLSLQSYPLLKRTSGDPFQQAVCARLLIAIIVQNWAVHIPCRI